MGKQAVEHTCDIVLELTDSTEYIRWCGMEDGAYRIRFSRLRCQDWHIAVCDCIGFQEAHGKTVMLLLSDEELAEAREKYGKYRYNDPFLRPGEPDVVVHSTTADAWKKICTDGMLKSWNRLKAEQGIQENHPIGILLGDPPSFSDYIMFGGGMTGEIVVCSRQAGRIVMDIDSSYITGARMYFDARKIAEDGLLIRDGNHLKTANYLPLEPYLLWTATWENTGLSSPVSTPRIFTEAADRVFYTEIFK